MKNVIIIPGADALQMLQKENPARWEQEIQAQRRTLESIMRIYNLSAGKAYEKCCRRGTGENAVALLAALHVMLSEEMENHNTRLAKTLDNIQVCEDNIDALKTSAFFTVNDKIMLTRYFTHKLAQHNRRLDEIVADSPVRDFEVVQPQQGLFDN